MVQTPADESTPDIGRRRVVLAGMAGEDHGLLAGWKGRGGLRQDIGGRAAAVDVQAGRQENSAGAPAAGRDLQHSQRGGGAVAGVGGHDKHQKTALAPAGGLFRCSAQGQFTDNQYGRRETRVIEQLFQQFFHRRLCRAGAPEAPGAFRRGARPEARKGIGGDDHRHRLGRSFRDCFEHYRHSRLHISIYTTKNRFRRVKARHGRMP